MGSGGGTAANAAIRLAGLTAILAISLAKTGRAQQDVPPCCVSSPKTDCVCCNTGKGCATLPYGDQPEAMGCDWIFVE